MSDIDNPRIWEGADVMVAPVGSTQPTDIATAWDAAFISLGLLGEDGLTLSGEHDTTEHRAYGGVHVRTTKSKFKKTFKVIALEDNKTVWALVNPGSTAATTTGITTRTVKTPTADPRAFGIEMTDGSITKRVVIPRGEVVDVSEISISDDSMAAFELTIEAYASEAGVFFIEITDDTQADVT